MDHPKEKEKVVCGKWIEIVRDKYEKNRRRVISIVSHVSPPPAAHRRRLSFAFYPFLPRVLFSSYLAISSLFSFSFSFSTFTHCIHEPYLVLYIYFYRMRLVIMRFFFSSRVNFNLLMSSLFMLINSTFYTSIQYQVC